MTDEAPETRRKSKPLPSENVANLWERQLLRNDNGGVKKLAHNIALLLVSDPEWRGAIAWDGFSERIVLRRPCPVGGPGPWTDLHDIEAAIWLQRSRWRLEVTSEMVAKAIPSAAQRQIFHPLRDKLNALTWDGVARVDTWMRDYLGAEDSDVSRAIASTWLLGAVARAFSPGCQVDAALVLEGVQGAGKSSALRALSLGFFTDEMPDIGTKDAAMQLHGTWIVELGELDALSRAEVTRVKSFITRRVDRFRAPYARYVADHPRSCVFAGTTNQGDYLRDETGNRRWLPVLCAVVRISELTQDAEQLWAEAVIRYRAGEHTYIKDPALLHALKEHTATRYQGDAWSETVVRYMQRVPDASIGEVLIDVGVDRAKWTHADQLRVSKILKSNGFERYRHGSGAARSWRYRKAVSGVHTSETGAYEEPCL